MVWVSIMHLWQYNALRFVGLTMLPTFTSHDIFKNPQIEADSQKLEQLLLSALQ